MTHRELQGNIMWRFLVFLVLESFLIIGSIGVDIKDITPWLLGINFAIAFFSVNFTFFGYQLSKYKAIYTEVTTRQWINISALLILPFLPLICFLITPDWFGLTALWILPVLIISAIDNAKLTAEYLDPNKFISNLMKGGKTSQYLNSISNIVRIEVKEHNSYLSDRDKFQIPVHAYDFEPTTLGIESNDLWDSIALITKLSIENDDYPVFRSSLKTMLKLTEQFYEFIPDSKGDDDYKVAEGMKAIARKRLRSIISSVIDLDRNGIFLQSLSSELCNFLIKEDMLKRPCSSIARAIASDAVWIGSKALETQSLIMPLKTLNTIHRVIELGIHHLETADTDESRKSIDEYNISSYAYDIETLGLAALRHDSPNFAYRCMETLSYLGCNAAKLKSTDTVTVVLESIVQMGRTAKHLKVGCFWTRCLIPIESHAEEFMGHILTWLVQDYSVNGGFYMKEHTEQAYSRLRGVQCVIRPKTKLGPKFWIEELKDDGDSIPHIERESGMWGYDGQIDYSDFSNLKDYVLYGISPDSDSQIIRTAPIPLQLSENEDSD